MIVASVAALFFLFNAGQLSQEKTKLVNAADAVAYSVGVMDARTLNFMAYTNRAMLANTVAIAQLVSLSSWAAYVVQLNDTGSTIDWQVEYMPAYPSWWAVQNSADGLDMLKSSGVLEDLAKASDEIIQNELMLAQVAAYGGLAVARSRIMKEVAEANYRNDGNVSAEFLRPDAATRFYDFVDRYEDDERTRFAEVAVASAKQDGFVRRRSWMLPGLTGSPCYDIPDLLVRAGGTDLIGFDEWKAMDTLSEHIWFVYYGICGIYEMPAGYAQTEAADNSASDTDWTRYDSARIQNPGAGFMASNNSESWGYSGLPKFYDLSEDYLDKEEKDLVVRYAVGLRRKIAETRTSEGVAQVKSSMAENRLARALNNYHAAPAAKSELVAASAVEVYFDRGSDNPYGSGTFGKPREIGSLFNPFWQVHLVSVDADERMLAVSNAVLP